MSEKTNEQHKPLSKRIQEHASALLIPCIFLLFSRARAREVIALQPEKDDMKYRAMVVTPIVGGNYTVRLMAEGFRIFDVTATS